MKVLISRISINQTVGGAELSARDICRSLTRLGCTSFYLTNLRSKVALKDIPKGQLFHSPLIYAQSTIIKKIVRPLNFFTLFICYFYILVKSQPDILNPQSRDDQIIATLVGKIFHIPVIWRDPGDLRPQLSHKINSPLQKINRSIQKSSILNSSAIFTLNKNDRDYLISNISGLDTTKVSVIKSNIMFEDYNIKKKGSGQNITIGCASRLDEHKGIQYVIEVFKKLQDKYHNISLLIAGDGVHKKKLESLAKGTKNITFFGHVNDVSKIFNSIDIFIQPAKFEGWGRNIKEAKYFGKAIVGSDVGGIKEQITHNKTGLLFNVGDTKLLYEQLEMLIDNPDKRRILSQNARKSAIKEGDWLRTVKDEIIPLFNKYTTTPKRKNI